MSSITIAISNNNLDVEREIANVIIGYAKILANGLANKSLEDKQFILNGIMNVINKTVEVEEPVIEEPVIEPVKPIIKLPKYDFESVDRLLDEVRSIKKFKVIIKPVVEPVVEVVEQPVSEECPICYDVMSNPVTTCCGHKYCQTCYDKLNTCAMCRTYLIKDEATTLQNRLNLERVMNALRDIVVYDIDVTNEDNYLISIADRYMNSEHVDLDNLYYTIERYLGLDELEVDINH
jgi:hypothetical protein